jgi:hypothetical protein
MGHLPDNRWLQRSFLGIGKGVVILAGPGAIAEDAEAFAEPEAGSSRGRDWLYATVPGFGVDSLMGGLAELRVLSWPLTKGPAPGVKIPGLLTDFQNNFYADRKTS